MSEDTQVPGLLSEAFFWEEEGGNTRRGVAQKSHGEREPQLKNYCIRLACEHIFGTYF